MARGELGLVAKLVKQEVMVVKVDLEEEAEMEAKVDKLEPWQFWELTQIP